MIAQLVHEGTAVAQSDSTTHRLFPVAIPATEGEALRTCVTRERAARTIEIGLGYGIAALFACEGLLENENTTARRVVVDPHQATRFDNCGLQFLDEAGVIDLVEYHPEGSETALSTLLERRTHFRPCVRRRQSSIRRRVRRPRLLGRLVRPGGLVFLDDYQLPSIRRAVSFFTTNLGWTIEEASTNDHRHHWAVLRTAHIPTERAFDHYVAF